MNVLIILTIMMFSWYAYGKLNLYILSICDSSPVSCNLEIQIVVLRITSYQVPEVKQGNESVKNNAFSCRKEKGKVFSANSKKKNYPASNFEIAREAFHHRKKRKLSKGKLAMTQHCGGGGDNK